MTIIQLFYAITYTGSTYFLISKRNFDFFTLSFFSSLVYFLPAFFGVVLDPYSNDFGNDYNILIEDCYIVYCLVLLLNLVIAIFFDFLIFDKNLNILSLRTKSTTQFHINIFWGAFCVSLFFFLLFYAKYGNVINLESKVDMLNALAGDRLNIIWTNATIIAFIYSLFLKSNRYILLASILLLPALYMGHRSHLAFCFLGYVYLRMQKLGKIRLLSLLFSKNFLLVLGVVIGIAFFFVIKTFIGFAKNSDGIDYVLDIMLNDLGGFFLNYGLLHSEPFITQANLNIVLKNNIIADTFSIKDIFSHLIIMGPELGLVSSKKYLQQEMFFPGLHWGTGSNIWAFIWSSYNWLGLLLFIFIYFSFIGYVTHISYHIKGLYKKSIYVYFFIVLCFYIHRNDLFFQIDMQKGVIYYGLFVFVVGVIIHSISQKFLKKI